MEIDRLIDKVVDEMVPGPIRSAESVRTPSCNWCWVCPECKSVVLEEIARNGASRIAADPGIGPMPRELAKMIDHTLLKPDATRDQVTRLCQEARQFGFASVCINPCWVPTCAELLEGTDVLVCTVVGFPLGANTSETKAFETKAAVGEGAEEIDMVMNVGWLKSGEYDAVADDVRAVVEAAGPGRTVKVILETCYLTDEEKIKAALLCKEAGAHFVKTSTGFGPKGATIGDVALLRRVVGPEIGVKAAGGIREYESAVQMIEAGANRIGASASVKIIGAGGSPGDGGA
jgi:deoxyribose-phosphate aldolase